MCIPAQSCVGYKSMHTSASAPCRRSFWRWPRDTVCMSCALLCWLFVNAHFRFGPVFAGVADSFPGSGPGIFLRRRCVCRLAVAECPKGRCHVHHARSHGWGWRACSATGGGGHPVAGGGSVGVAPLGHRRVTGTPSMPGHLDVVGGLDL